MTMVGAVVSTTEIVNVLVRELPVRSAVVHDTTVGPIGYVWPDGLSHFIVGSGSTRSTTVGAEYETTAPLFEVASTWMTGPGRYVKVGATVSTTVSVNCADTVCPSASVALQVTLVWPSGSVLPDAGVHVTASGWPSA